MVVLSADQVRQYKGVGASALKGVEEKNRGLLEEAEHSKGRPIVGYIVDVHHLQGKSVADLAKELSINEISLHNILRRNAVPTLTRGETLLRRKETGTGLFGVSPEQRRAWGATGGRIGGRITAEQGLGFLAATPEQRRRWSIKGGKKGGKITAEQGLGFYGCTLEQRSEWGSKGGRIAGRANADKGLGIHGASPEQRSIWSSEAGKIGGRVSVEQGLGIHVSTPEQRKEYGKLGGRISGKRNAARGLGVHGATPEEKSRWGAEGGRIAGKRNAERGVGVHGATPELRIIWSSEGGRSTVERGLGIFAATPEERMDWRIKGGSLGGKIAGRANANLHRGLFGATPEEKSRWGAEGGKIAGRMSTALETGIHDPLTRNEFLQTLHGYRRDIGFDARSMWEANTARILIYLGFQIMPHNEVLINRGTPEEKKLIADFLGVSIRGTSYYFEIIAGAYGTKRSGKVSMFEPHLAARLIRITKEKYNALVDAYRFGHLKGNGPKLELETMEDNVDTNPAKWRA